MYRSLWSKKAHDWVVDKLPDLFHTTHRVKTPQVVKNWGQHDGDIVLGGYLQNEVGTVSLVLDLLIAHERWVSNTDPTLNGNLHYPNDLDKPLNEPATTKLESTSPNYNQNPPYS